MRYENLRALIERSNSTRRYFLSLPVEMQMALGEYHDDYIHTAEELHRRVDELAAMEEHERRLKQENTKER